MEIVRRRRTTVPVPRGWTCERCGRSLSRDAFVQSEKLAGGRHPWCIECAGKMSNDAEARVAYKAAYQRSYMRRRREDSNLCWLVITVQGRGRMLARWSAPRQEVKITGAFALREDAMRVLTGPFGCALADILESGAGAGRGVRRQKTFSSRAPVGREAWERGRDLLVAEGVARVGKGGGA